MPRKIAIPEEVTFRLDANLLPQDLFPHPEQVRRWYSSNILQAGWFIGFGWAGDRIKPLAVTDAGWLKVTAAEVPYEHSKVFTGTAADTWSADLVFASVVSRIDIFVWDNPLEFQRAVEDGSYEESIEIPTNTMYSFDAVTKKIRVKNRTAAANSRYQIVGWF